MTALEITNWLEEKIEHYPNKDRLSSLLKTFKQELMGSAPPAKAKENSILGDLEKFKYNIEKVKEEMEELDKKMMELNKINEQICRGLETHPEKTSNDVAEPLEASILSLLLAPTKKIH